MFKNVKSICSIGILSIIIPFITLADSEIRKITPPKIDDAHLGQKIICYRPMREGAPNMSIEQQDGKIIANNYGHGGSGWTLAPGSSEYVYNLLNTSSYAKDLPKTTPVTIVGAGVIGLFTAYTLHQKGFQNITIVAEKTTGLPSNNAAGLLAPVSMDNDPAIQKTIDEIGIEAYKLYDSIAKKKHPHFKKGAIAVPAYFRTREESGLEPYVEAKVMRPAKEVVLDFGNGTTQKMISYDDGIFIDTGELMQELTGYLKSKNVKFVQKKINSFTELKDKIIFNCTGLGSKELNNDDKLGISTGSLDYA